MKKLSRKWRKSIDDDRSSLPISDDLASAEDSRPMDTEEQEELIRSLEKTQSEQSLLWRRVFAVFLCCYAAFLLFSIYQQASSPWDLRFHAYFMEDLDSWMVISAGCCKPPTACGYNYVNPTLCLNPANPTADPDCYLWSNDQTQLCYNCESCKAGLLGNLRKEWRKANIILIAAVVVLIWVYVIGCSAFKNAQTEDLFRKYKQGWA